MIPYVPQSSKSNHFHSIKRVKATPTEFLNGALTPDMRMNTDEVCDYFQQNVQGQSRILAGTEPIDQNET